MRTDAGLDALFARVAQSIANATLRLDKTSAERLATLEGRAIQVEGTLPGQVWCIRIRDARIEVLTGLADSPDAVVRGKPQDLLAWFVSPDGQAAERVEIEGDRTLLVALAGVFKALAPTGLSPPIRGQDLLGAAELAAAVLGSAAESVADAWREAAVGRFANRADQDDFQSGIERLEVEVKRLSARVRDLESARRNQSPTASADTDNHAPHPESAAPEYEPTPGTTDGPNSGEAAT